MAPWRGLRPQNPMQQEAAAYVTGRAELEPATLDYECYWRQSGGPRWTKLLREQVGGFLLDPGMTLLFLAPSWFDCWFGKHIERPSDGSSIPARRHELPCRLTRPGEESTLLHSPRVFDPTGNIECQIAQIVRLGGNVSSSRRMTTFASTQRGGSWTRKWLGSGHPAATSPSTACFVSWSARITSHGPATSRCRRAQACESNAIQTSATIRMSRNARTSSRSAYASWLAISIPPCRCRAKHISHRSP